MNAQEISSEHTMIQTFYAVIESDPGNDLLLRKVIGEGTPKEVYDRAEQAFKELGWKVICIKRYPAEFQV